MTQRKMIDAEKLASYFRNKVHAPKAAALVDKFAAENSEEVIAAGEPLPAGKYTLCYSPKDSTVTMIRSEDARTNAG